MRRKIQRFCKLSPEQKTRIVAALRKKHTVGFMGDGINDASAMKAADVGVSVDTAVDIAKESADIILTEKDLNVLEQGIMEGRRHLRQHDEVYQADGQQQFRQHALHSGGQRFPAVPADGSGADSDSEHDLRHLLPGASL
jgi:P-type E1-E2 ATPase